MNNILIKNKLVCLDDIHIAYDFKTIAEHMSSHDYHAAAIVKFNYYPRPIGYERDAKCYILGQHPSVDAALKNDLDEIEVDLIDPDTDINQFMAVFLSKEHLNRKARVAYIKMVVDYLRTDAGKVWATESYNTKDIEDILVELTDKSASSIKHLLKLIKPEYKAILDKYCNYELSLFEAYNNCNGKTTAQKPKTGTKPSSSSNTTTTAVTPVANEKADTPSYHSEFDDLFNGNGTGDGSSGTKDVPAPTAHSTTPTISPAEAINQYAPDTSVLTYQNFFRKAILELEDGQKIEVTGRITLYIDGTVIVSTSGLVKLENGNWSIPTTCKTYNLAVMKAA